MPGKDYYNSKPKAADTLLGAAAVQVQTSAAEQKRFAEQYQRQKCLEMALGFCSQNSGFDVLQVAKGFYNYIYGEPDGKAEA